MLAFICLPIACCAAMVVWIQCTIAFTAYGANCLCLAGCCAAGMVCNIVFRIASCAFMPMLHFIFAPIRFPCMCMCRGINRNILRAGLSLAVFGIAYCYGSFAFCKVISVCHCIVCYFCYITVAILCRYNHTGRIEVVTCGIDGLGRWSSHRNACQRLGCRRGGVVHCEHRGTPKKWLSAGNKAYYTRFPHP